MKGWRAFLPLGALMAFFFGLYSYLPSTRLTIYASPDETAHAVMTENLAQYGRAYIEDAQIFDLPWLHPRSWVGIGSRAVPVGFLGWSVFLVPFFWLVGARGLAWVGVAVFVSGVWPFFQLVRHHLRGSDAERMRWAWLACLLVWSFPSFILYGNRSLFPNSPLLVGFLWSSWLLYSLRWEEERDRVHAIRCVLTAACIGLTLTIRPVECFWMLPWWVWFGMKMKRPSRQQLLLMVMGFALAVLPATIFAAQTYGAWFTNGYWQHERAIASVWSTPISTDAVAANTLAVFSILPFGFHPHHIWWNVLSFFLIFLGVWVWPSLIASGYALYEWYRDPTRKTRWTWSALLPWALIGWTMVSLMIIYGSGLYMDHVRVGAVTIGNSFLRYTLPLVCLLGWLFAWMCSRGTTKMSRRVIMICLCVGVVFGMYRAFFADDEGLFYTRAELLRYQSVREVAERQFSPHAVIFSDRSDKIFFPVLRAVSPLPPMTEIARLARLQVDIGLFARPLSQSQKDAWHQAGFDVQELGSFGRERLYKLLLPSP